MRLEGQREKKERKKKATPVPKKTSKDNTTVIDDVEVAGKPQLYFSFEHPGPLDSPYYY